MKNFKTLLSIMVGAAFVFSAAPSYAKDKLVIWEESGKARSLDEIVKKFEEMYDCEVEVSAELMYSQKAKLKELGPRGLGPDIVLLPSDVIAVAIKEDLITPVKFMQAEVDKYLPMAVQALSHNGVFYAVPKSVECLVLFYNKDIIKDVPDNLEELMELSYERKRTTGNYGLISRWDDFYYSYGVFSALGAYVFKVLNDGSYDIENYGLDKPVVAKVLNDLRKYYKQGIIDPGSFGLEGFVRSDSLFTTGNAFAIISGPWAADTYKNAGVNFGVKVLPRTSNGQIMRPFVGIKGYAISRWTEKHDLAEKFLQFANEYENALSRYHITNEIPPTIELLNSPELNNDEMAQAMAQQVTMCSELPSITEMAFVWPAMHDVLYDAMTTTKSIESLLKIAKERIYSDIERANNSDAKKK